jgi:hypothetical protein
MSEIPARVKRFYGVGQGVVCSIAANKFTLNVSFGY